MDVSSTVYENSKKEVGGLEKQKKKGLEFMSTRFNVAFKRRELRTSKAVTPAEYYLLEEIEMGTYGAQNKKRTISTKAEFYLEDLSKHLGYKEMDKIWRLLKSLHKKNLITREPTRSKGVEVLGLNPAEFGQILIDSQHALEQKRHLKLVKNEPTDRRSSTDEPSVTHRRTVGGEPTNRRQSTHENGDKTSLDLSKSLLDGENEESYAHGGTGPGTLSPEEAKKFIHKNWSGLRSMPK